MTAKGSKFRIEAVDLALTVLSTLAVSQGLSTEELAQKLGGSPDLVATILDKLVERRFVFRDLLNLHWLGPQLYYLGGHTSERNALIQACSDTLDELARDTRETVTVVMRERFEAVLAASRGSSELLGLQPIAASRGPLHHGGGAKLLLAYAPQDVIDHVIDEHLDAFTPASIRSRKDALDLMENIRRDGLYVAVGESHPDVISISAPIRDAHNRVVAALLVLSFKDRFTAEHQERLTRLVVNGAKQISSRLG